MSLKQVLILLFILFSIKAFSQTSTTINVQDCMSNTNNMSLSKNEKCIYFSSMDWYSIVKCVDENGKTICRFNVKHVAKHQTSQFVAMSYSEFDDGEYVIIVRNWKKKEIVTFRIFDNNTYAVLCDSK